MPQFNPLAIFAGNAHAPFASDGVQLAFGRRWDGVIIHISQAERGKACGCTCPACGRTLIAHKKDIAHHFEHFPLTPAERAAGMPPICKHGNMTALHAYAEQLVNEKKALVIPPLDVPAIGRRPAYSLRPATRCIFDSADLEKMDGETIPDVILHKGTRRVHVEIRVTHACGPEKRAKITSARISAIEIDLSKAPRDMILQDLDNLILRSSPRKWINNALVQRKFQEHLASDAREARQRANKRAKDVAALSREYEATQRRALALNPHGDELIRSIMVDGHGALLYGPSGGEGFFSVHPMIWKAQVLRMLPSRYPLSSRSEGTNVAELVRGLRTKSFIVEKYQRLAAANDPIMSDVTLFYGSAESTVEAFLQFLSAKKVAVYSWAWHLTESYCGECNRLAYERRRKAEQAAAQRARRAEVIRLAENIAAFDDNPESGAIFSTDIWINYRIEGGRTPGEIADEGGAAWSDFKKSMTTTLAVLHDKSEEPAHDFGLPVRSQLTRMLAIHAKRAEDRRLAAQQAEQAASQDRINRLVHRAETILYGEHLSWLETPHADLGALSPRQAGARSANDLAITLRLLEEFAFALAEKEKWVGRLKREASRVLKTPQERDVWMTCAHSRLPGRVSPIAYTKDERTLFECLGLLRSGRGAR